MAGEAGRSHARLGELLTRARKLSGLSQQQAAEKIGVTRRSLGEWETTGVVSADRMNQLRDLYGDNFRLAEISMSAEPASVADEPPDALTVVYRGYRFTMYPRAGATAEEIAKAQDEVLSAVMDKLRALGLDDTPEAGTP